MRSFVGRPGGNTGRGKQFITLSRLGKEVDGSSTITTKDRSDGRDPAISAHPAAPNAKWMVPEVWVWRGHGRFVWTGTRDRNVGSGPPRKSSGGRVAFLWSPGWDGADLSRIPPEIGV